MEERRKISRVDFEANSIIVDRETGTTYRGSVKNVSPLGIAIIVPADTNLVGRDVIIVAETMIMYADTVREDVGTGPDTKLLAFHARKFTPEVLQYLFDCISNTSGEV